MTSSKLSKADEQKCMVRRMVIDDMSLFPSLPYNFNCVLNKELRPLSQPYAYINLNSYNRSVAKADLIKVNAVIAESKRLSNLIPQNIRISVDEIVYDQQDSKYGYTKLICSPHTYSGKLSKYPARLLFMTDLSKTNNNSHGDLYYDAEGKISKAEVNIWRNKNGFFYKLKNIDGELVVVQISSTIKTKSGGLPEIIYKRNT